MTRKKHRSYSESYWQELILVRQDRIDELKQEIALLEMQIDEIEKKIIKEYKEQIK